jgi:hypothetical protein
LKGTAKPGAVVVWPLAIGGEKVSIVRQAWWSQLITFSGTILSTTRFVLAKDR